MLTQEQVQRFAQRFRGLQRAYGRYELAGAPTSPGSKRQGRAITIKGELTEDLYRQHLEGRQGLGVVPITDGGTVAWGCIDVDSYDVKHEELYERLKELPVVLCRSKSGGAHIFTFFNELVSAALCRDKLGELAALLGLGGSEVFPKQIKLITEHGDTGNWLNLPYFAGDRSTRYAYAGRSLSLDEFLVLADKRALTAEGLQDWVITPAQVSADEPFKDGPPCLRILSQFGFPEGFRNKALYSVGVYLKKRFPDDWENQLNVYNVQYMRPPLPVSEVINTAKSISKKDYNYKCHEEPIRSHCDRANCLTQLYGVSSDGATSNLPSFNGLTKVETDPPIWFVTADGQRIGPLQTNDWINYGRFVVKVVEQTNQMLPVKVSPSRWNKICAELLQNLETIEMPDDVSTAGMLWSYLIELIEHQNPAPTKLEFIKGNHHYEDNSFIYVKFKSLAEHLRRHRFPLDQNMIAVYLREKGASITTLTEGKISTSAWRIPNTIIDDYEFDLPNVQEKDF